MTTTRKYYLGRRWKITWTTLAIGPGRVRIVKHYERRQAIGSPWQYVRGSACVAIQ